MSDPGILVDRTYRGSDFEARGVSEEVFENFWLGSVASINGGLRYKIPMGAPAFPIYSASSELVGWGFRPDNPDFKYFYHEVPVSTHLYGLNLALPHILEAREVIVVEGFFDVLVGWSAGYKNLVGAFSNSLSKNQIILLGSITQNIKLAFDSDNAGLKGDKSSVENIKKILPDMNVSHFLFYPYHDFCDYAKARLEYAAEIQ